MSAGNVPASAAAIPSFHPLPEMILVRREGVLWTS